MGENFLQGESVAKWRAREGKLTFEAFIAFFLYRAHTTTGTSYHCKRERYATLEFVSAKARGHKGGQVV